MPVNPWKIDIQTAQQLLDAAIARVNEFSLDLETDFEYGDDGVMHPIPDRDDPEGRAQAEEDQEQLLDRLRGRPDFADRLVEWMVFVQGPTCDDFDFDAAVDQVAEKLETTMPTSEDALRKEVEDVVNTVGPLAQDVQQFVKDAGYRIHSQGVGEKEWRFGCHCTLAEARELCQKLRDRFAVPLDLGLLSVDLSQWAAYFRQ